MREITLDGAKWLKFEITMEIDALCRKRDSVSCLDAGMLFGVVSRKESKSEREWLTSYWGEPATPLFFRVADENMVVPGKRIGSCCSFDSRAYAFFLGRRANSTVAFGDCTGSFPLACRSISLLPHLLERRRIA
ncbi:hypothetical protein C1879_10735 [Paraeggerthella hongkongensis]|nr:hypothetical protein C1879_10735 [Paraeggerthella hongkongensis]